MIKETFILTAIPAGIRNGKCQVSVFIQPRFDMLPGIPVTPSPATLNDCPLFKDWPAKVAAAKFQLEFLDANGAVLGTITRTEGLNLERILPESNSSDPSGVWPYLFVAANLPNRPPVSIEVNQPKIRASDTIALRPGPALKKWNEWHDMLKPLVVPIRPNPFGPDPAPPAAGWDLTGLGNKALELKTQMPRIMQIRQSYIQNRPLPTSFQVSDFELELSRFAIVSEKQLSNNLVIDPPAPPPGLQGIVAAVHAQPSFAKIFGLIVDLAFTADVSTLNNSITVRVKMLDSTGVPLQGTRSCRTSIDFSTANQFRPKPQDSASFAGGFIAFDQPDVLVHLNDPTDLYGQIHKVGQSDSLGEGQILRMMQSSVSKGIAVSMSNPQPKIDSDFKRSEGLTGGLADPNFEPILYLEDVIRGIRPDVAHCNALDRPQSRWKPLCRRNVQCKVVADGSDFRFDDGGVSSSKVQEGTVEVIAQAVKTSAGTKYWLQNLHFRWSGYNLAAPRPHSLRDLNGDQVIHPSSSASIDSLSFSTIITASDGYLPPLRFGKFYRFRFRWADIAGNSVPPLTASPSTVNVETVLRQYKRSEIISPPIISLKSNPKPLESSTHIVIRSLWINGAFQLESIAERWLSPPVAEEGLVEAHGILDKGNPFVSWPDSSTFASDRYKILKDLPGTPDKRIASDGKITYLADPAARAWIIGDTSGQALNGINHEFSPLSQWPDIRPVSVKLIEGNSAPTMSTADGSLTFSLPRAGRSHYLFWSVPPIPSGISDRSSGALIYDMIDFQNRNPQIMKTLLSGTDQQPATYDPRINPPDQFDLLHAVQVPLTPPTLVTDAKPERKPSSASVKIGPGEALLVPGSSADHLTIEARWSVVIDDGFSDVVGEIPKSQIIASHLEATQTSFSLEHSTGDLKHHRIEYSFKAQSRFASYFPGLPTQTPDAQIEQSRRIIDVPSQVDPSAPMIVEVLPSFLWESGRPVGNSGFQFARRTALRIYLARPWFVTGGDEYLGVWAAVDDPSTSGTMIGRDVNRDPGTGAPLASSVSYPRTAEMFAFAPVGNNAPVQIACHMVLFDPERKLWYADIEIDSVRGYFPFVRLMLSRVQKFGVSGKQVSTASLAEVVQLVPKRTMTVTQAGTTYTFRVTGDDTLPNSQNLVAKAYSRQNPFLPITDLEHSQNQQDTAVFPAPGTEIQIGAPVKILKDGNHIGWSFDVNPGSTDKIQVELAEYEIMPTESSPGRVIFSYIFNSP